MLITRDLIDFFFYYILVFLFLAIFSYHCIKKLNLSRKNLTFLALNKRNYKINLLKYLIGPFFFTFLNLPIFVITFLNDYYLLTLPSFNQSNKINLEFFIKIEIFYIISYVLNQLNLLILLFINILFNKHFLKEGGILDVGID